MPEVVLIAPQSPWQHPYVERLIGSIRHERLDHVIVRHEQHLLLCYDTLAHAYGSQAPSHHLAGVAYPPEQGASHAHVLASAFA
jgi:hypothetical protein